MCLKRGHINPPRVKEGFNVGRPCSPHLGSNDSFPRGTSLGQEPYVSFPQWNPLGLGHKSLPQASLDVNVGSVLVSSLSILSPPSFHIGKLSCPLKSVSCPLSCPKCRETSFFFRIDQLSGLTEVFINSVQSTLQASNSID